jgi:hypothetical protein
VLTLALLFLAAGGWALHRRYVSVLNFQKNGLKDEVCSQRADFSLKWTSCSFVDHAMALRVHLKSTRCHSQ